MLVQLLQLFLCGFHSKTFDQLVCDVTHLINNKELREKVIDIEIEFNPDPNEAVLWAFSNELPIDCNMFRMSCMNRSL